MTVLCPSSPGAPLPSPSITAGLVSALAVAMCLATAPARAADAAQPASYALRLPITAAPDASLQRLQLPAAALTALQSPGYADVRIFNAAGQAVPMAMSGTSGRLQTDRRQLALAAYPVLGSAAARGLDGMTLRIEEHGGRRTVQVQTADTPAATAARQPAQVLGVLLDARKVDAPVTALALDADLPDAQPVTFNLQASRDLKTWRPLGDTVLFRAGGQAAGTTLGEGQFSLDAADVKDHYLRITWSGADGQPAAVTVRGATLTTSRSSRGERVAAPLAVPAIDGTHAFSLALPFATPPSAVLIVPAGGNVLVPVRLLGRNDRSQPWTPMASTVVYRLQSAGSTQASGAVELQGAAFREIRVEADARTPGFAAPPAVTLLFDPAEIVFLATGQAPFTLAAGLAAAPPAWLALGSVIPGYRTGQESSLPQARVEAPAPGAAGIAVGGAGSGLPTRDWVLWGVLLAGVALLGGMAWVLMRQMGTAGKVEP